MPRPAPSPAPAITPLPATAGPDAEEVLWSGFRDTPFMRWCFDAASTGYEARTRRYFRTGHDWHLRVGQPAWATRRDGVLAGVAYLARPETPLPDGAADALARRLRARCGDAAAARFARYQEQLDAASPPGRFLGLSLIAVRHEHQGRGLGSAMVERLCREADADAACQGVLLDTDSAENVRFYRRFGFEVVRELHLDDLHVRILVRPRDGGPATDSSCPRS